MQILLVLWLGGMAATAPTVYRSDSVPVRAVPDGRTIQVATYGRVRLLGLAAPEEGKIGADAREVLAALVLHRWVHLEQEGERIEAFNRHLAYVVRDDGLFVNAELVRRGVARVATSGGAGRLAELTRAEAEARSLRRGLWAQPPRPAGDDSAVAPERPRRYTSPSASGSSTTRKKKKKS